MNASSTASSPVPEWQWKFVFDLFSNGEELASVETMEKYFRAENKPPLMSLLSELRKEGPSQQGITFARFLSAVERATAGVVPWLHCLERKVDDKPGSSAKDNGQLKEDGEYKYTTNYPHARVFRTRSEESHTSSTVSPQLKELMQTVTEQKRLISKLESDKKWLLRQLFAYKAQCKEEDTSGEYNEWPEEESLSNTSLDSIYND